MKYQFAQLCSRLVRHNGFVFSNKYSSVALDLFIGQIITEPLAWHDYRAFVVVFTFSCGRRDFLQLVCDGVDMILYHGGG